MMIVAPECRISEKKQKEREGDDENAKGEDEQVGEGVHVALLQTIHQQVNLPILTDFEDILGGESIVPF